MPDRDVVPPDSAAAVAFWGNDAALPLPTLLLAALRRRKLLFTAVALAFPLLAAIALSRIPPSYTASGTVFYDPGDYSVSELQSILRDDPATDAVMASQAELLRGMGAVTALTSTLHLDRMPEFNPALQPKPGWLGRIRESLQALPPLAWWQPPAMPSPPAIDASGIDPRVLLLVQMAISVQTLRNSHVLEVSFVSTDPLLSAAAVNALMQYYLDDQIAAKQMAIGRANAWLDNRVAALKRDVGQAEDRIAAYRASNGLVQGVQAGLDTEQVSRLDSDLLAARADLAQWEGKLQLLRGQAVDGAGADSGAAAQAAVAPSVGPLRDQAELLAAQAQAQATRYGPNHPDAIALSQQLAEARHAVAAETEREARAIEAEVRSRRARVATLEADLSAAQAQVSRNAQLRIPLDAMERDAAASRALLLAVEERSQQTAQQAAIAREDARIVSMALVPLFPSAPKSRLIIALALLGGVITALALLLALEGGDSTVKGGEEIRLWFHLPCFALVPEVRRRQRGRMRIADYAARKPLSAFAEQLRALRAGLWLGGRAPLVIAITAARPGEGKTAIAMGLGRASALGGERVLVLDCDIREPALGRQLQADAKRGLTDLLQGFATMEQVVCNDSLTGMRFIPAGSPQTNSCRLFLSTAMEQLLIAARPHFDLILLDAPPVLALTDARAVARHAEATLLCVRWRQTPRRVVRHALDLLAEAQAKVCGVVLTRVDARAHGRAGYADSDIYHPRYGGYFSD